MRLFFVLMFALLVPQEVRPPVIVAVAYSGPSGASPAEDASQRRRDLATIRRAGFNAVEVGVRTEELAAAANDLGLAMLDPSGQKTTRIDVGPGGLAPPRARLAFWTAIASGARYVTLVPTTGDLADVLSLGETAGIVTRNEKLFAPLRPRARGVREIRGVAGPSIEIKLLESDETIVIVGVNYSASPTRATIAFDADLPEAIWQNMETGTSVSFLMTEKGPELEHTFGSNDALVLMIRKKLRL